MKVLISSIGSRGEAQPILGLPQHAHDSGDERAP
jgi:hypothetical protein